MTLLANQSRAPESADLHLPNSYLLHNCADPRRNPSEAAPVPGSLTGRAGRAVVSVHGFPGPAKPVLPGSSLERPEFVSLKPRHGDLGQPGQPGGGSPIHTTKRGRDWL